MNVTLRRGMAAAALSSLAMMPLASTTVTSAHADDTVECSEQELVDSLAAAEDAESAARVAFVEVKGPLNAEVKDQRVQLRAAAKESRAELKELLRELKGADAAAERERIHELIKAESEELRAELRLLRSPRELVAEVKAQRAEAKEAWRAAKLALVEARQAVEDCAAEPTPEPTPEPEPTPVP